MDFQEDNIDIRKEIKLYTSRWKLFLLSAVASIALAYFYLKIAPVIYTSTTTILIKDPDESRGMSELAALSDLSAVADFGSSDIDDEVEILKSKTLIEDVVRDLGVATRIYKKGQFKAVSVYKKAPFNVEFIWDPIQYKEISQYPKQSFEVTLKENGRYTLVDFVRNKKSYSGKLGEVLFIEDGQLVLTKTDLFNSLFLEEVVQNIFTVEVKSISQAAVDFQRLIQVAAKSKKSSVVDLTLTGDDQVRARDILNKLVDKYNEQAINDKNLVSRNTSKFINERLNIITAELNQVENQKSSFKRKNNLADIQSEAQLFIEQVGDTQQKEFELETQINLTNSIIYYLANESRGTDLLPANIGIDNTSINLQIQEFNKLVLQRDRLLEGSTKENPLVINLNSNISSQKSVLKESLRNQLNNLNITKENLMTQKKLITSKINSIPDQEKSFRSIERKQSIKETLYLFLLEKREETSISMAVTAPVAKIIDRAYTNRLPISPKTKIVYLAALILGLIVPFAWVYIRNLTNTKVETKQDVLDVVPNIPVLVEVPALKSSEEHTLVQNDRSSLGESFRILRTNLNYILRPKYKKDKALKVFITSTIKGEGKTLISFNTVLSYANSNKKVLIVGADIRNPQIHRYIDGAKNSEGLTEYLHDPSVKAKDLIQSLEYNDCQFDLINSGKIPPNPSELLMNGRFEQFMAELETQYDIIIVDTAPTMLVTDTLLLSDHADTIMYVVRSKYTEKNILNHLKDLLEAKKLQNVSFIINGVDHDKIGYGYGYGYGAQKKSFFKRVFG